MNRENRELSINEITEKVIGCAIAVHTELGPGLLESAYQECLFHELQLEGLNVEKEKPLPLVYKDVKMECGYRVDLLVENKVIIVELKSVEALTNVHVAQVLTYLKLSNNKIGLLINFNSFRIKDGLRRLINKYYSPPISQRINSDSSVVK
ncbi:GxxExxY protein [Ekhidna lutea]|uniref:GxxExxY protein n=1 Tax=Ekhidna lutea TaxID=447679 RepID=A0A239KCG1_EKHLU|nr:GxxExxY protein [Ekhidna lutea]SNT16066.1 GxxExxY protein [Ekhidna lutea]